MTHSGTSESRPNIIVVMTDQQRGDCLGVEGRHPILTPTLDALATQGTRFTRAYSTCPVCIPARRSFLSGQFPGTHGMTANAEGREWDPAHTLPGVLRDAGYQTHLVGRSMHQFPSRKRFGYDEMVINPDYQSWLEGVLPIDVEHDPSAKYGGPSLSTGVLHNDWTARTWPYDEQAHLTNWTVSQARRFLRRRDPSCPFFLTISFLAPHPPLVPPSFYFDRYLRCELPPPAIGSWAEPPEGVVEPNSSRVNLQGEAERSMRAAYYGLINHLDDQLRRVIGPIPGIPEFDLANTIVVFTSDHGEMLGDHHRFRKSLPYEGAARIPMIIRAPERFGQVAGAVHDVPVGLEDLFPTLVHLAGLEIPDSVEGRSLVPLMRDEPAEWRSHLHVEHAPTFHALVDGRHKYIWFAEDGREQLFDLHRDPDECHDLASSPQAAGLLATWRQKLVAELTDRPESFVVDGQLCPGGQYPAVVPSTLG